MLLPLLQNLQTAGGGDVSVALTGQAVSVSAGTLAPSTTVAASGQAATASAGTLTPNSSIVLSGQLVNVSAGTLSANVAGDITVSLTGQAVSVLAGTLTAVAPSSSTGAGSRRKRRRRLVVDINGEDFEVSDQDEALELLAKAREVALKAVEKARAAPIRIDRGIQRPRIATTSAELRPIVRQAREDIKSLYDELIRDLEIRALMARAEEDDDEETLIRFLM
jgi:hypothetical protein